MNEAINEEIKRIKTENFFRKLISAIKIIVWSSLLAIAIVHVMVSDKFN